MIKKYKNYFHEVGCGILERAWHSESEGWGCSSVSSFIWMKKLSKSFPSSRKCTPPNEEFRLEDLREPSILAFYLFWRGKKKRMWHEHQRSIVLPMIWTFKYAAARFQRKDGPSLYVCYPPPSILPPCLFHPTARNSTPTSQNKGGLYH